MNVITDYSREERALYNPAFTAIVVCRAVQGHERQFAGPCSIVVATLSAVMALQPAVRRTLPKTLKSGLNRWLEENKSVRVAMSQNATALATVVRPGLLLALQSNVLQCADDGKLEVVPGRLMKTINGATVEVRSIQKAAYMLGRWLPSTGSLSTAMALMGVRP